MLNYPHSHPFSIKDGEGRLLAELKSYNEHIVPLSVWRMPDGEGETGGEVIGTRIPE